jgi:hypothetical protein
MHWLLSDCGSVCVMYLVLGLLCVIVKILGDRFSVHMCWVFCYVVLRVARINNFSQSPQPQNFDSERNQRLTPLSVASKFAKNGRAATNLPGVIFTDKHEECIEE